MKKIMICLNPFESHFLSMISFVKNLEESGFFVLLIGDGRLKKIVENEGFKYISLSTFWEKEIQFLKKNKEFKQMEVLYKSCHEEIYGLFCEYKPDYILMGISRFHWYLKPALDYDTKIFLYSLCSGIPYFNKNSPPITSDYISKDNIKCKIHNLQLWFMRMKRKGINRNILEEKQYYPWKNMKKICKKKEIKWKFGIDGFFPDLPILIFGTRRFEFIENKNLLYLGINIREYSTQQEIELKNDTEKLIYCSFGTMSYRYEKYQEFLLELVEVFRERTHWKMILSIGKAMNSDSLNLPDNVIVYQYAPQIEILKQADLVITHGGFGTIKESIYYGVPILVFPCSYDQRGNAARVHYLQIGIRSLMLETTRDEGKKINSAEMIDRENIKQLIDEALYNPKYKENMINMKNRIESQEEMIEICKCIFGDKPDNELSE